jgi:hypothetical protein
MSRVYEALHAAAAAADPAGRSVAWQEGLSIDESAAASAGAAPAIAEFPREQPPEPVRSGVPAPPAHRPAVLTAGQRPACTFDELIRAIARDEQQFDS